MSSDAKVLEELCRLTPLMRSVNLKAAAILHTLIGLLFDGDAARLHSLYVCAIALSQDALAEIGQE